MNILVIDIGGSTVKFKLCGDREEMCRFPSGKKMTPEQMVDQVLAHTEAWQYERVSIGFPGIVLHGKPAADPGNLGNGWTRFDFEKAFKKPVKLMNDAAMQALGNYRGGRMLFIGLGTGLGSALILDDVIVPLELGQLSYSLDQTLEDVLSKSARKRNGEEEWEQAVHKSSERLIAAFRTDYLVIGGGGAEVLKQLPEGTTRSSNLKAFTGGERLWNESGFQTKAQEHTWIIT